MTLPIKRRMAPPGRNNPGAALNAGELWFVVHETGNYDPGTGAAMHAAFVAGGGGKDNVSFHLTVDEREAYQMLPLSVIGYHAADGCDDRHADYGCYRGIAIETCVNDGNRHAASTRANLIELIARVCIGDERIDYGGRKPSDFSPDRIADHYTVSVTKKNCPTTMRRDGFVPKIPGLVRSKIAQLQGITPAPAVEHALERTLFGPRFDPNGPVSQAWLAHARQTGLYPALKREVRVGGKRHFLFEGGLVIHQVGGRWVPMEGAKG